MAAEFRRLGRANAVLFAARLSRHRVRPAGARTLGSDLGRQRHGPLRRRSGGNDGEAGPKRRNSRWALDRWGGGGALHWPTRNETGGQSGVDWGSASSHGEERQKPRWGADFRV